MFIVWTRGPSKGARKLARALGGRRIRADWEQAIGITSGKTWINWGDSQCPIPSCLNSPEAIAKMANKLTAFNVFQAANVPIPKFAATPEDVSWGGTTVVRHKLTGHSGEGIEIVEGKELPSAPLYVQYIPKKDEYRIHVGKHASIISVQRKARRNSVPDDAVNWQVRNHCNGFVFVRQSVHPPECVIGAAKQALEASGLDFGAVDVIYNAQQDKAYVLEINTAPGLEGQTVQDYKAFFTGM